MSSPPRDYARRRIESKGRRIAVSALIEAVPAPAKVILFGSQARGNAGEFSDFDLLVIEREVEDRFGRWLV